MRRRIQSNTGSGKKKLGALITLFVVIGIVIILVGLLLVNSKKQLIERPYGIFKTLTIREAFENAFGTVTVQYTADGVKISASDQANRYVAQITSSGMKVFLNGQPYENSDEMYRLNIYGRALYNLVLLNAPTGYESFEPKSPINYLKDVTYDYIQDNKEYIKVIGIDPENRDIEIWYSISRNNEKFTVAVEKVTIDKKELSQVEEKLFLARVYKKNVETDLIEVVQNSSLEKYDNIPLKDVFSKLANVKWTIKDEQEKIVELNASDFQDINKTITLGFKIGDDGFSRIEYMYSDGKPIDNEGITAYVDVLYKEFGFAPTLTLESEVNEYKEKILSSAVPYSSPQITFSEFFSQYLKELSWEYERVSEGLKYTVSALTKDSQPFEISFLCKDGKVYLSEIKLNASVTDFSKLKDILAGGSISDTTLTSTTRLIDIVKKSKLVTTSPVINNEKAFSTILTDMNWTEDQAEKTVILKGSGKYGTQKSNFRFIFYVGDLNKVFIRESYINNMQMIDEVQNYIISKAFNIPSLSNDIIELVKNSILNEKTYMQILGKNGWSIDKTFDRVFFDNGKLKVFFSVEPNGDVKPVQLIYNNDNLSNRILDILQELEMGRNIVDIVNAYQKQTDLAQKKTTESTSSANQQTQPIQNVQNTQVTSRTLQSAETKIDNSKTNGTESEKAQIPNNKTTNFTEQKTANKLDIVKKSKLKHESKFLNNERAFNTYLYDPNWTYDTITDEVILTGKSHYNNKFVEMKFVFEIKTPSTVILKELFIDGAKADATTTEKVLLRIFFPDKKETLETTTNNVTSKDTKDETEILQDTNQDTDSNEPGGGTL
ncbi:hypothetical protein [Fervidobacterium sp.]